MLRSAGLFGAWRGGHDLLRSVDNNTTTMDLQQGLKVKRRAREGGLIMGALVELEKARSCGARECVKERSRLTMVSPGTDEVVEEDDRVTIHGEA